MGLRKPSRVQTLFAQAASGTQQQEEARQKLKKPEALGGSASMGTGMVAAQTEAQKGVTQKVSDTATEMATNVAGTKIATPTSTAGAYTTNTPSEVTAAEGVKSIDVDTSKAFNDTFQVVLPPNPNNIVFPQGATFNVPNFSSVEAYSIDELNKNLTTIDSALENINKAITAHNAGISDLSASDIKNLEAQKEKLMTEWNKYNDALTKENLGQIAGPSTFETDMEASQQTLAARGGGNVGKLQAAFGSRWAPTSTEAKALASQMYGKDLEAIQEAASAGLSEKERANRQNLASIEAYKKQLDTSKKSVEDKVESETNKVNALKNGWETLKKQGENLESLSKLFGSPEEAKKYFAFDAQGNLTGDRRSEQLTKLSSTADALKTEKGKTQGKIETNQNKIFTDLRDSIISKDQYGNPTGGALTTLKNQINSSGDQTFINNLAVVENEINNAIDAKDTERLKAAQQKLNNLSIEFMDMQLKSLGKVNINFSPDFGFRW